MQEDIKMKVISMQKQQINYSKLVSIMLLITTVVVFNYMQQFIQKKLKKTQAIFLQSHMD